MKYIIFLLFLTNTMAFATTRLPNSYINKDELKKSIVDDLFKEYTDTLKDDLPSLHQQIIRNHEKLIQNPESIEPLLTLTRIYYVLGQLEDATYFSHRALLLDPKNTSALFLSAMLDVEKDNIEEAIEHLFQLKKESDNGRVIRLLSGILSNQNQSNNAIQILKPYVLQNPTDVMAKYELGILYVQVGLKDTGIEYIEEANIHYPDDINILQNLAAAYFSNNQLQKSIDTQNHIVQIAPARFVERRLLSEMYLINEDIDRAKKQIFLLLEFGDRSIDLMFILSCFHAVNEQWETSLELTNKILDKAESFMPAKILKYFLLKNIGKELEAESYLQEHNFSNVWHTILEQKMTDGSNFISILISNTLMVKSN